jgi:hypothetical protein
VQVERAAAVHGGGGGGGATTADHMESGATSAADTVEDLTARASRLTTSYAAAPAASVTAAVVAAGHGGSASRAAGGSTAAAKGEQQAHAASGRQRDHLVSLLVSEIWPLAQAVCLEGAYGRFLHQYAKSTVLLLRVRPEALLPLLPQMLAVCGACFCRPAGYSLGEVLSAAVVTYCRVEGSKAPLDCTPHILQVGTLCMCVSLLNVCVTQPHATTHHSTSPTLPTPPNSEPHIQSNLMQTRPSPASSPTRT